MDVRKSDALGTQSTQEREREREREEEEEEALLFL